MKKIPSILAIVLMVVGALAIGFFVGLTIDKNSSNTDVIATEAPIVSVPTCPVAEVPVMVVPTETNVPTVEPTHDNRPMFYISDWRFMLDAGDEVLYPTEPFTATVILFNGGQSEWGKDFKFVWVGGEFMGTEEIQIGQKAQYNGFVQFDVDLMAPNAKAGTYTSWWMLETEDGVRFGSGYDGMRVVAITVVIE